MKDATMPTTPKKKSHLPSARRFRNGHRTAPINAPKMQRRVKKAKTGSIGGAPISQTDHDVAASHHHKGCRRACDALAHIGSSVDNRAACAPSLVDSAAVQARSARGGPRWEIVRRHGPPAPARR